MSFKPRSDDGLKEGHHGAEAGTVLLARPGGQEIRATLFIFLDPFFGEAAVADFGEEFFHFVASLLSDDAGAGGIVAMLGSIADRVTHVAETAAINENDNELKLVETLEVGNLRLIAGVGERLETGLDQFAHAAAKDRLFAEEVGFGFLGKGGFKNARPRAAEAAGVGESESLGVAGGVLMNGDQSGRAAAFGEDFAHA